MYYEDQGDFRMAEDSFVKSGKPREAIDASHIHQHEFDSVCVSQRATTSPRSQRSASHARVLFQQGQHHDEVLLLRANSAELLLSFTSTRRCTATPNALPGVLPREACRNCPCCGRCRNDPLQAVRVEDNGEYQLAIEQYLRASKATATRTSWWRCGLAPSSWLRTARPL